VRPTREGIRYLLATFLIGFASYNTGNNLIYLILGILLSVFAISWGALWLNLRQLEIRVETPYPVFAGSDSSITVTVQNMKKRLTSYSLNIRFSEDLVEGSAFVPVVKPGHSVSIEQVVKFSRRGRFSYGDVSVDSSFPFIFFVRKIKARIRGGGIVLPRIRDIKMPNISGGGEGDSTSIRTGKSEDLISIRHFRDGDDLKSMSWKATARMGEPMVKEHAMPVPRAITVLLDNSAPPDKRNFERAVSSAASVVWHYATNSDYRVGLSMCGTQIMPGEGVEHAYLLLETLALVEDGQSLECPDIEGDEGVFVIVVKSDSSYMASAATGPGVYLINVS